MKIKDVLYLPSGRIFILETNDQYIIEATEMRDVSVDGKEHFEVRNSLDPHVIWKHIVPFEDKWLLTVSTQKGCPYTCQFCDVGPLNFKGNLTTDEILDQVSILIDNSKYVQTCRKAKIGFARMGEPSTNLQNVLDAICKLPLVTSTYKRNFNWLPCFNTILPQSVAHETISEVILCKEAMFDGFLHFQISCNSTDEEKRIELFGDAHPMPIDEIITEINNYDITNRTVTLNFIVMKDIEVSVEKLIKMGLHPGKFTVKLIPLNMTENATKHNLETYANYSNYEDLLKLRDEFQEAGIPVVVDAIAKCEEAGLCCGQLAQMYL